MELEPWRQVEGVAAAERLPCPPPLKEAVSEPEGVAEAETGMETVALGEGVGDCESEALAQALALGEALALRVPALAPPPPPPLPSLGEGDTEALAVGEALVEGEEVSVGEGDTV